MNARKKQTLFLSISIIVLGFTLALIIFVLLQIGFFNAIFNPQPAVNIETTQTESETEAVPVEETEVQTEFPALFIEGMANPTLSQDDIYCFLQGPRAWKSKAPYSGSWCGEELAGSLFSVFGCGLCDLSNIYSTLSPYDCSPIDMFYYAKEVSDYSPGGGVGAIDWPYMQKTLNTLGFTCSLRKKDKTYEKFCNAIEHSLTAIALVSCYNDDSYWTSTEGHYVNLWSYNSESEMVYLADSGDPEHNQTWIPLKTVYDALKTSSSYQYMLVYSYEEDKNTWKHDGITEAWTKPKNYRGK